MKYNFTIRLYRDEKRHPALTDIQNISISDIVLVSKTSKFDGLCLHKSNQKKYKYSIELSKPFKRAAGSNSYPILWFDGEYIDITIKNFPRYPAFYQDIHYVRNIMRGYSGNSINDGFPIQLLYRKLEIKIF